MVENDCSAGFGENNFEAVQLHETGHSERGRAFLPKQMWQLRLISDAISNSASSEILANSPGRRRQTWWIQYFNSKTIRSWAEKMCLHHLKKYSFLVAGKEHVGCHRWKERKPRPTKVLNLLHASPLSTLCQVTASHKACKIQGSEVAAEDGYRSRSGREDFSLNYELPAISPPPLKFQALCFIFTQFCVWDSFLC